MTVRETFHEIRNYLAGQFVGATRDESILAEVVKCLFAAHLDRAAGRADSGASPVDRARYYRALFRRARTAHPDLFDPADEILLGPEALTWTMARLAPPRRRGQRHRPHRRCLRGLHGGGPARSWPRYCCA